MRFPVSCFVFLRADSGSFISTAGDSRDPPSAQVTAAMAWHGLPRQSAVKRREGWESETLFR